jgi:hypothetical protein
VNILKMKAACYFETTAVNSIHSIDILAFWDKRNNSTNVVPLDKQETILTL